MFTFVMSPPDPEVDFCGSWLAAAVVEAIMFVGCLIDFLALRIVGPWWNFIYLDKISIRAQEWSHFKSVLLKLLGRAPWLVQRYDWGFSGATVNAITIGNLWPAGGANLITNHLQNTTEVRTISVIALSIKAKILQHMASSHQPLKGLQE